MNHDYKNLSPCFLDVKCLFFNGIFAGQNMIFFVVIYTIIQKPRGGPNSYANFTILDSPYWACFWATHPKAVTRGGDQLRTPKLSSYKNSTGGDTLMTFSINKNINLLFFQFSLAIHSLCFSLISPGTWNYDPRRIFHADAILQQIFEIVKQYLLIFFLK